MLILNLPISSIGSAIGVSEFETVAFVASLVFNCGAGIIGDDIAGNLLLCINKGRVDESHWESPLLSQYVFGGQYCIELSIVSFAPLLFIS